MYNFEENYLDVAVLWSRSMEFAIAADDRSIEKYNTYMIEKHKLISESDGLEISVLTCVDDVAPKAVFQIVHGMCEHKERYVPFMEFLASKGYAVVIHDHRGHGESVRSVEDLGYFYEGGWKAMIDDIRLVNRWAHGRWMGLPLVLFGHSMGSMAVRSYTKRYDDTLDALFVCGCPSFNSGAGVGKALARAIGGLKGERHRPRLIQKIAFGSYSRNFKGETSPNCWVCSNPSIIKEYDADPLCNYVFTANGFRNLFGLMQDCYSTKGWKVSRPSIPVRFISGADDPCLISPKAFESAVENMRRVGYSDVSGRLYQGMRHEILNETDRQKVWDDVVATTDKTVEGMA